MSVLEAIGDKPLKYPFKHDPNESKFYPMAWGANLRLNGNEYLVDDVVVPAVANGFKYVCVSPGVSAAAEPVMATAIDEITDDGTVQWLARPYDYMMRRGDSFDLTIPPAWSIDVAGATLSNAGYDDYSCWVQVSGVPAGTKNFLLTNTVYILRADTKVEKYERSIKVKVATL